MDLLAPVKRFDRVQQEHAWLAIPVGTVKKFSSDSAGNLAALVAYYGFFSLFPLLLVFVTILGFVLAGDRSLMESIRTSVLGQFPVIGTSIKTGRLRGSVLALLLGLLLSLYSGLGVIQSLQNAFNTIWGVPKGERPNFLRSRLHAVRALVLLGTMFIVASGAAGVVSGGLDGTVRCVIAVLISVPINFALFMLSFKLLCAADPPWRSLIPGAVMAAVLWELLQLVGGAYIDHIKHSADTYGAFALVIGVLTWLHLGAQITMYSAELNVVLAERHWPVSLFGNPDQEKDLGDEGAPSGEGSPEPEPTPDDRVSAG